MTDGIIELTTDLDDEDGFDKYTACSDRFLTNRLRDWMEHAPQFYDGCVMPGLGKAEMEGEDSYKPQMWLEWALCRLHARYRDEPKVAAFFAACPARVQRFTMREIADTAIPEDVRDIGDLIMLCEQVETEREKDRNSTMLDNPLAGTW